LIQSSRASSSQAFVLETAFLDAFPPYSRIGPDGIVQDDVTGIRLPLPFSDIRKEVFMNKNTVLLFSLLFLLVPGFSIFGEAADSWEDFTVKVGDIKVHYLEAGSGERTLVFIPGWTMTAEVWKEQLPYFSARGFRVIAIDPRSHGDSSKTEDGNTYRQHAADLHEFLLRLKIKDFILVGWASGATALLEYAVSPETYRPEKIVFVDATPACLKLDDFAGSMTLQQARDIFFGFEEEREKATEKLIRSMFKARQPEYVIKDLIKWSRETPIGAAISLHFDFFTGDRRPALKYIDVPTLIVTTPENRSAGEYMQSNIPRSNLKVIEGTGTAIFLDKPQAFNQALESFLGEY
jgi:non-heme chloroperoxidase